MKTGKKIIGILGGICSGKSTVAAEFGKLGCAAIDADGLAQELLTDNNIKEKLSEAFGQVIFAADGSIDRLRLGEAAFADAEKAAQINKIIHPKVLQKCEDLIAEYEKLDDVRAIVLDMPLLLEVGWAKRCDNLIFVDCDEQIRAKRARKKGISFKNQLKKRENLQISLDSKAKIAHYIVDNNSGLSAVAKQVTRIFTTIIE
jgi:dephospho-CoA kinase